MDQIVFDILPEADRPTAFVPRARIVSDMDIEDYHDLGNIQKHGFDNAVISKSMLPAMLCPEDFHWQYVLGNCEPDKDHLNVGNAVHTLALEPDLFRKRFHVIGEGVKRDARTQAYKDEISTADGRKMLTAKDYKAVKGMAEALRRKTKALALLDASGKIEASIFWEDEETGVKLRCRPDFMRDDGLTVDLKTTHTADPSIFFRTAWDFHYDISAAVTWEGYKQLTGHDPQNYCFLVIEDKPPHKIEIFDSVRPDQFGNVAYIDSGRVRFRKLLEKYVFCRDNDYWPSYNDKVVPMGYPGYANKFLSTGEM